MSWLFSQALVEAFLRENSWAGGPSARWNVMPTARPFWRSDKPMDASRFSRFGATSKLLTEADGEALSTWFQEVFLARTSPSRVAAWASMAHTAVSGPTWYESFARYDPRLPGWRTRQLSLLGDLDVFSETWPSWGLMRAGECWERPTWALPTFAEESGLLPTPTTIDSGSRFNRSPSESAILRPTLGAMARYNLWPTPTVKGNYNRKGVSAKSGDGLATAVRRFPTPTVSMSRGSSSGALTRNSGRSRENDRLDYAIEGAALHGRLNPEFVEWLMGWPSGWSDSRRLEMARFHEWRQQHGITSPDP